ncbi:hypothetical protein H5410_021007, partial [Solanum commersonii]
MSPNFKEKDNKFRTRNIGYTDHTVLKWFSVGLAVELTFSSLVSFQTLSPESFETKSGLGSLSLICYSFIVMLIRNFKTSLFRETTLRIFHNIISSICKDSLQYNPLTETTLRKMKGSFHTDVPPSYMNYVENRVVENLRLEYVQRKELPEDLDFGLRIN